MDPLIPEPGTRLEGPFPSYSCAVLNDLQARVHVPAFVLDMAMKNAGLKSLLWPLGAYLGFTEEGLNLGLYGRGDDGQLIHGISQQEFQEDKIPPMGEEVWALWKKYRRPPFSLNFVVLGNYQSLLKETRTRHGISSA